MSKGKAIVDSITTGDVVLVKFGDIWGYRGMKVLEIEEGFIAGFYLDFVDCQVPTETPKKDGYRYTKPNNYNNIWVKDGKNIPVINEWDNKTFKKTRTYETKMIKFVKEKVDNAVIIK